MKWIYHILAYLLVALIMTGAILEAVDEHARKLEEGPRTVVAQSVGESVR